MTTDNYPQEITAEEKSLGFEILVVEGYGLPHESLHLSDVRLVVKRLSSSEILVKLMFFGQLTYSHKQYGKDKAFENKLDEIRAEWWPLFDPCPDAKFAIARFESGNSGQAFAGEVIPFPIKFKTS